MRVLAEIGTHQFRLDAAIVVPMGSYEILIAILPLAALAYAVAERISAPYPVLLVIACPILGALPWVHPLHLSPHVVFAVSLPTLDLVRGAVRLAR